MDANNDEQERPARLRLSAEEVAKRMSEFPTRALKVVAAVRRARAKSIDAIGKTPTAQVVEKYKVELVRLSRAERVELVHFLIETLE